MEATPKDLFIFETDDGCAPFSIWMDGIEGQPIYNKVMNRLDRLELGNFGDHKSVGEGVVELRIDFGPGYRIYIGQDGTDVVILLIGGDKSSQAADIEAAQEYWKAYNA
jgi:putative addiction module killer protein